MILARVIFIVGEFVTLLISLVCCVLYAFGPSHNADAAIWAGAASIWIANALIADLREVL